MATPTTPLSIGLLTATGVAVVPLVEPSPSWPYSRFPQQYNWPFLMAQV
jgi:hypothetical protein